MYVYIYIHTYIYIYIYIERERERESERSEEVFIPLLEYISTYKSHIHMYIYIHIHVYTYTYKEVSSSLQRSFSPFSCMSFSANVPVGTELICRK